MKYFRNFFILLLLSSLVFPVSAQVTALGDDTSEPDWPNISPYEWTDPDNPEIVLTLSAELKGNSDGTQFWIAKAIDSWTGDTVALVSAMITYNDINTTWILTAERFENRFGFEPIPPTETEEVFETEYNDDGDMWVADIGDLTWLAAFLGANALDPFVAGGGGWTPNGCNKPCSNKWKKCCDKHDACYCAGGTAADRKKCDRKFRACLRAAGMGRIKAAIYYRAVRLFGWYFFNYKENVEFQSFLDTPWYLEP